MGRGHTKIHPFSPTIFIKSHIENQQKKFTKNSKKRVLNPPESDCHQVLPHSWSHRSGQNPWYHGWFRWRWRQIEGGGWHWWWRRRKTTHLWEGAPSPEVNSLGGKFDFPSWDYFRDIFLTPWGASLIRSWDHLRVISFSIFNLRNSQQ